LPFAIVICAPPEGGWADGVIEFSGSLVGTAAFGPGEAAYCRVFRPRVEARTASREGSMAQFVLHAHCRREKKGADRSAPSFCGYARSFTLR